MSQFLDEGLSFGCRRRGRLRGRGGDLPGGCRALASGADYAAAGRAGSDEKLDGISGQP